MFILFEPNTDHIPKVEYYVGLSCSTCTKYWPLAPQVKDDYFRGCLTCTKYWPPSQIKDDYFIG